MLAATLRQSSAWTGANALLIEAVERGDLNAAKDAIERGAQASTARKRVTCEVEMPDGNREAESCLGETVLCLAVRDGRADMVEALLVAGANPNTPISWKIANVVDWWTPENWDDGAGAWDDDNLTFSSTLEFALTRDRWPFNPPGADITVDNPVAEEQVCKWISVDPRTDIVALLLRHGSKVGDDEKKAAKALEGDGAEEMRRLVESHAPPEKHERSKRVVGPGGLSRMNTAPVAFSLGLFDNGRTDGARMAPVKEEQSALSRLEEKQRKEIADLKKKLRELQRTSAEREAEQKLLIKSQGTKIAELVEALGNGPEKRVEELEQKFAEMEADFSHREDDYQQTIAELERKIHDDLTDYDAHIADYEHKLEENKKMLEAQQRRHEQNQRAIASLEETVADLTASLHKREEDHARELAGIAEATARNRSETVELDELRRALREADDVLSLREAEHQRRVGELEWTLRGQSETFTRREEESQQRITELERALRDHSFMAHTKEQEQAVRIAELEHIIAGRPPTHEEREAELLSRIKELEDSIRFEVSAQRQRDHEHERTVATVLQRQIEAHQLSLGTLEHQLGEADRMIQHLRGTCTQLEGLVQDRDRKIQSLEGDVGVARIHVGELEHALATARSANGRPDKFFPPAAEPLWSSVLYPVANGLDAKESHLTSALGTAISAQRRARPKVVTSVSLPAKTMLRVVCPYSPQRKDEVLLSPGDEVICIFEHDDGWCVGTNKTTIQSGVFPRVCVTRMTSGLSDVSPTTILFPERRSSLGRIHK
ncbi:hypothetical protein M427DRAFT_54362 [Gonapodya prolifera JEL478]|uniref:SH3 domain-containing protein n=1 Tax=Gonapodya prolifera (strain JEL478) TaxID=1344416 RepID=A0A139ALX0_GONPJ|nr:hypothetical protein M427DRAFT_54362 [Gonapodya prolifera JEL478]|eukprot:KXS17776.1 hypothetical protein M427DRAFT_54362 [Gonapodya prolifera JEL478]